MEHMPDEEMVRQAELDWNKAIHQQDVATAASLLADDFVLTGGTQPDATPVERDVWLQALAAMKINTYRAEVTRLRVYGDSAAVSIQGSQNFVLSDSEIDENFIALDLWIRRAEGWKIVLRHSTLLLRGQD